MDNNAPCGSKTGNNALTVNENYNYVAKSTICNCIVCNDRIIEGEEGEDCVACDICDGWSHIRCSMSKTIFDILNKVEEEKKKTGKKLIKAGGLFYFCDKCKCSRRNSAATPKQVARQPQEVEMPHTSLPTSQTTPVVVDDSRFLTGKQNVTGGSATIPSNLQVHANDAVRQAIPGKQSFCYHYKKDRCRHGKNGKKLINGRECMYPHPQKCMKYCRYGYDKFQGCNGSCNLFHPTLCQSSINFRECFSSRCTFTHLVGTERYERFKSDQPYQSYNEGGQYNMAQKSNFDAYGRHGALQRSYPRNNRERVTYSTSDRQNYPSTG